MGLFLIPFDNVPFAPSAGWAAVAPFCFFIYIIINFKYIKNIIYNGFNKKIVFSVIYIILISIIQYIRFGINVSFILDSLGTFVLGVSFYLSLKIYYENYKNIDSIIKYIYYGYVVGFIYGIFQYLCLKIGLINLLNMIQKRTYDRLSYSFTEPSFTSVHIFGVLLMIILFVPNSKYYEKIKRLIILYILGMFITLSSTRFLIDVVVIIAILGLSKINLKRIKLKPVYLLLIPIIFMGLSIVLSSNRISVILEKGIYYDASLASRWFRINSAIYGFKNDVFDGLIGYGMGNSYCMVMKGTDQAFLEYENSYLYEVISVMNYPKDSYFCMYVKLIAEFGLVFTIFLLVNIFSKKYWIQFLIIAYLYIQFDSYAFYSIWLYLFFIYKNKGV
ncbi:MAG: hypothetical protein ACI4WH_00050 [Oscillospiraceae bacterium]